MCECVCSPRFSFSIAWVFWAYSRSVINSFLYVFFFWFRGKTAEKSQSKFLIGVDAVGEHMYTFIYNLHYTSKHLAIIPLRLVGKRKHKQICTHSKSSCVSVLFHMMHEAHNLIYGIWDLFGRLFRSVSCIFRVDVFIPSCLYNHFKSVMCMMSLSFHLLCISSKTKAKINWNHKNHTNDLWPVCERCVKHQSHSTESFDGEWEWKIFHYTCIQFKSKRCCPHEPNVWNDLVNWMVFDFLQFFFCVWHIPRMELDWPFVFIIKFSIIIAQVKFIKIVWYCHLFLIHRSISWCSVFENSFQST